MQQLTTNYENSSLSQLADQINADFYEPIRQQCEQTSAQLSVDTNKEALEQIRNFVELKQRTLLKYMAALAEKSATGHDCSICPGGCEMGHAEHLTYIQQSHMMINSHLAAIDMNEMPDELQQLSNLVVNLLQIEDQVLVPKISDAQKRINVIS